MMAQQMTVRARIASTMTPHGYANLGWQVVVKEGELSVKGGLTRSLRNDDEASSDVDEREQKLHL